MHWQRHWMVRIMRARPRLIVSTAVAVAAGMLLPAVLAVQPITRWLLAWNVGTTLYVLLAADMMLRSTRQQIDRRAQFQDDGQLVILALVVVSAVASLLAIGRELAVVRDLHGITRTAHVALACYTVVASWAFTQVMFALHYAHEYYAAALERRSPGLRFPEDDQPDYGDFFHFAAVIGTSGQTADVAFVSKRMRRIGSLHCILAYLFNTTVLALLINIGAGLV